MDFQNYFPIWNKLNSNHQKQILSTLTTRTVKKGTIVHNGGNDCTGLLLVKSGQLRAYILSDEGREITIYRLFDRDMCLFSASCMMRSIQFDITIEAEKDTDLWIIPVEVYQSIMAESAPVANYTNELMATRFSDVQSLGYTLEWRGQYLRIRPDNSTKFFRMDKLGEGYTYEDVQQRIKDNMLNRRIISYAPYKPKEKPKGLVALYIHYCYLLGELPKQKPNNREAYAVIKEDVRRAHMYNEEAKLLGKYNINTAEELSSFTEGLSNKFKELAYKRAKLRNKLRRMHDTETMQPIKDEISQLSLQMAELRKQMKLCEDIAARSGVIERVVNTIDIPDKDLQRRNPNETKTKEREDKR